MDPESRDEPHDKWAALTESLGVEPKTQESKSQESGQEPPDQATTSQTVPAASAVQHSLPSRPKSGWNDLPTALGLTVDEPEPPAEEKSPPEAAQAATASPASDVGAQHEHEAFEGPAIEPTEADVAQNVDEPAVDVEVVDVVIRDTRVEVEAEKATEEDRTQRESEAAEPAPTPAESPAAGIPPTPEAAPPAGFGGGGLTLPDWFPFGGRKKSRPPAEQESPVEQAAEPAIEPTATDTASSTEAAPATKDETAPTEKRRSRRRRGRRRGRGGGKEAATADAVAEQVVEADEDTFADTADGEGETEDAPDQSQKGRAVSHKNIPSWSEAIGVVVDANIAARGDRTRTSRGRGGSSRGGRGRRRKKKDA